MRFSRVIDLPSHCIACRHEQAAGVRVHSLGGISVSPNRAGVRCLAAAALGLTLLTWAACGKTQQPAAAPSAGAKAENAASASVSPSAITVPEPTVTVDASLAPTESAAPNESTAATLTAAEQALIAKLSPSEFTNCRHHDGELLPGGDQIAAVDCDAVSPGTNHAVLVTNFSNGTALSTWLAGATTATQHDSSAKCKQGATTITTWQLHNQTLGDMACDQEDGSARLAWTQYSSNVAVIAQGENATSLFTWWENISLIN